MKTLNSLLKLHLSWCTYNVIFLLTINLVIRHGWTYEYSYPERQRFESLLAGGRPLAFPFSTGFLLAIIRAEKTNWNISQIGLENLLNLSVDQIMPLYSSAIQDFQKDENITLSSVIYPLHEGWNSTSMENLNKLATVVTPVIWDSRNANETWEIMNNQLAENTNGLLDDKLIPKNSGLGTPFPFSTESTIITTFHYQNFWRNPWRAAGLQRFFGSGDVPFIKMEGEMEFAEEDDFTAVKIPLEGDSKSVVFVLPKVNITKYFKTVVARSENYQFNDDSNEDIVPFPKNWEKKLLSVLIPPFNLSASDQYGLELQELGMNQTFCTTLHDRTGKIPYYLRPVVQYNRVLLSQNSLEIASATGTAIQKFLLGLDIGGNGYPRSEIQSPFEQEEFSISSTISGSIPMQLPDERQTYDKMIFNKPFLWYLNDIKVGPIFYGIVQKIANPSEEDENMSSAEISQAKEEAEKFILWSCKTFKQSGEIGNENELHKSDL